MTQKKKSLGEFPHHRLINSFNSATNGLSKFGIIYKKKLGNKLTRVKKRSQVIGFIRGKKLAPYTSFVYR